MNQYLYRIQPSRLAMLAQGATPEEEAVIDAHFSYLQDLTRRGVVLLAGRTLNTDPSAFGIVIFEAESDQAALAIMQADPAVRAGVMRAELFPYRVALLAEE